MIKYQQGDVIIRRVKDIPASAKVKKDGIIAEGEATGHAHAVADRSLAEVLQDGNDLYVSVTGELVTVTHQEHGKIDLPKGKYKIGIVRTVDPFTEEISSVKD